MNASGLLRRVDVLRALIYDHQPMRVNLLGRPDEDAVEET